MMKWLFCHRRRRTCSLCPLIMMSLDSMFDLFDAMVPGFPIPAAAKLSSNDVQNGLLESIEVAVWNLSSFVLVFEMVKFGLQYFRLIEEVDGDVQSAQDALGVSDELGVVRVLAMHPLEEVT